jgi:hypothetical protein
VVLGVLSAAAAIAGLLLVFIGFLYSRAESYETRRGNRFRYVAKAGLIPFAVSLICTWLCVDWLTGAVGLYSWIVLGFRIVLVLTFVYGLISLLWFL